MVSRFLVAIVFVTFCLCLNSNAFARSPAVEPVMGISIDNLEDVPPEKSKAFDFSTPAKTKAPIKRSVAEIKQTVTKEQFLKATTPSKSAKSSNTSIILLIIFLFSLPFVVWGGMAHFFHQPKSEEELSNALDFNSYAEKKKKDNDMDFPKAS